MAFDSDSELLEFQARFEVDDRCIDYLKVLPSHVQQTVLNEFRHDPGQTNASARCVAFAKKVMQSEYQDAATATTSPLQQFQAKWGIDDRCADFLASLSPEVQNAVFAAFDHQPGQTNVSARCFAFARSMQQKQAHQVVLTPLQHFQAQWGVDDRCAEFLASLAPEIQDQVFATFVHQPGQTNVSARCFAFARSIQQKAQQQSPLQQFQARWGVDDRCAEFLASLPPEAQQTVFATFDHKPGQTNVSARCFAFARSVQQKHMPQQVVVLTPLQQFQSHWGIDDHCAEFLATLPPDAQDSVFRTFSHQPGQTNVSARCFAFARSVQQKHQVTHIPMRVPPPPTHILAPPPPQGVKRKADFGYGSQGYASHGLQNFGAYWGIDDQCMQYLSSLPIHVQDAVMAGFQHNADQTNVSARCFAFAKKILQSQPHDNRAPSWTPLQQFQHSWGIDDKCMEFLASMSPAAQAVVIETFDHQPGQTNVSARCFAFARKVQEKHAHGAAGRDVLR